MGLSYKVGWPVVACTTAFFVVILLPFWLLPKGLYWLITALLLLPVIPAIESLLLTPLYRVSGRFVYYSKTLFVTRSDKGLQLHAGTLYDYLGLLYQHKRSAKIKHKLSARRLLTEQLLQGLLALCDDIAKGNIAPSSHISATSYFFSERSATKLSFTKAPVSTIERINLLTAALSLAIRLSISKGRLTWPKLRNIKHMNTTAAGLLARRLEIEQLLNVSQRSRERTSKWRKND